MSKKKIAVFSSMTIFFTCINCLFTSAVYEEESQYALDSYIIGKDNIVYVSNEDELDIPAEVPDAGSLSLTNLTIAMNENPTANFAIWINPYYLSDFYKEEVNEFQTQQEINGVTYSDWLNNPLRSYEIDEKILFDTKCYLLNLEVERLKENGVAVTSIAQNRSYRNFIYAIVNSEELNSLPFNENIGYQIGLASMPGDVQTDGAVDILDVVTINKTILGKANLSEIQVNSADINKNGVPDSEDSLEIMKYIVGLTETLNEY